MIKSQPMQRTRRALAAQRFRRVRTSASARQAAAAVEFAIVANVFFILLLACMEFSRLNMVRNLSQDAAYYAARQVIVPGATSSEAIAEGNRIMSSLLSHGYTVEVSAIDSESNDVVVTVSVDLEQVALFAPYFLPDTTIRTVARVNTERYDGFYRQ